jgi:malate dehydrogenase (oxaloacetate-decarboxylating)
MLTNSSSFLGTAGLGIADGIRNALMLEAGLTSEEVRKIFW